MNILLLKLKKDKYLIRKNPNKYLSDFNIFAVVNKENQLTGYSLWNKNNGIYLINKDTNNKKLLKLIGESKINKLKTKDYYGVYCLNDVKPLPYIQLDKVNGLRFAKEHEKELISDSIVKKLYYEYNITFKDKLYNNPNYQELYSFCMEYDLEKSLFKH